MTRPQIDDYHNVIAQTRVFCAGGSNVLQSIHPAFAFLPLERRSLEAMAVPPHDSQGQLFGAQEVALAKKVSRRGCEGALTNLDLMNDDLLTATTPASAPHSFIDRGKRLDLTAKSTDLLRAEPLQSLLPWHHTEPDNSFHRKSSFCLFAKLHLLANHSRFT